MRSLDGDAMDDSTRDTLVAVMRVLSASVHASGRGFDETINYWYTYLTDLYALVDRDLKIGVADQVRAANRELDTTVLLLIAAAVKQLPGSEPPPSFRRLRDQPATSETAALKAGLQRLCSKFGDELVEGTWDVLVHALSPIWDETQRLTDEARERTRLELLLIFQNLFANLRKLDRDIVAGEPMQRKLWYAASLMADLAYYRVLDDELDSTMLRARLMVPSEAFQDLATTGRSVSIEMMSAAEGPEGAVFTVNTDKVVAVGVTVGRRAYIGYRGTMFLYGQDWRINRRVAMASIGPAAIAGSYHSGFSDEALRITRLVQDELAKRQHVTEIVLSGHSLGGAIAGISQILLRSGALENVLAITFGAPRFCNMAAYRARNKLHNALPVQIRRYGDAVPLIPPKFLGYAEPVLQFPPSGGAIIAGSSVTYDVLRAVLGFGWFAATLAKDHSMEKYRRDCEPEDKSYSLGERLADLTEIKPSDCVR